MAIAPTQFPTGPALLPAVVRAAPSGLWHRLLRHRLAQIGLSIIFVLVLVAFSAPLISRIDPTEALQKPAHIANGLSPLGEPHAPSAGFPLGADTLGRDVWTRTLYGARISLIVGVFAMLTAVVFGTTVGLLSGYFGGWVDGALMRFTEIVMSLPTVLLAIALVIVLPDDPIPLPWGGEGNRKIFNLLLAISLVTWTGIARAVRGQVLSLKEQEFIESARAIGCSHARILFVHLLPNVLPTIIVLATLATAHNILLEAGLSYLGLGIDPATPSWGGMIAEGQPYILTAPWILLAPGFAIVVAVAGFNLVGQALQEVLDRRA